ATAALQRETRTIPILFVSVADPVVSGIVPRLNQPGGNVTGFASLEASLAGKWLELLSEIAPGLKRAAIMFNPDQQFSFWHLVVFWGAAPCDEFGWEWLTGVRAGVAAVLRRPRFAAGLARKERSGKW